MTEDSLGTIEDEWSEPNLGHLSRMYSSRRGDKHQREDFLTASIALLIHSELKNDFLRWLKPKGLVGKKKVEVESITQHRLSNNKIADLILRLTAPDMEPRYIVIEAKIGNDFPTERQLQQYHFTSDNHVEYRIVAQRRTFKGNSLAVNGRRWKCISWEDLVGRLSKKTPPPPLAQSLIDVMSKFGIGEFLTKTIDKNFMTGFHRQVGPMVAVFDAVKTQIDSGPLSTILTRYTGSEIRNQSRLIDKFKVSNTTDTHLLIGSFPEKGLCVLVERWSKSDTNNTRSKMIGRLDELNAGITSGSKWTGTPNEDWTAYYRLFKCNKNSTFDDLLQFFSESIAMIENFGGVNDLLGLP